MYVKASEISLWANSDLNFTVCSKYMWLAVEYMLQLIFGFS